MIANELGKKPFKKNDIIVYLILAVLTAVLLIPTFYKPKHSSFTATVDGETVLKYDYSSQKYTVYGDRVEIISPTQFRINAVGGYNVLTVDVQSHRVSVSDTDCGKSKECTKMGSGGVIICVPHRLVVKGSDRQSIKVG